MEPRRPSTLALVVWTLIWTTAAIKLNVPRVLLPYSQSVSANFTLEVTDGGCFNWYVSRPEVVKLHLLDDGNGTEDHRGCSSRAVVTSSSRHSASRQSALVVIRNEATGETLHCDVVVASIHELEITTTTRELLLEDTPEAFTLRAKDKEGDTFSSIDGLVFEWSLVTDTGGDEIVDAYRVLRFMKFSESLYKASPSVYDLESQGLQGYTMLVQGIKTGTAIVRSALKDAAYPEPLTTEVMLTVIANLILWPSYEVYVIVGSVWSYEVQLIQHGKSLKISMPSAQYYLSLTDDTVARLNPETSEVEAVSLGHAILVLKDRNVKTKQAFRQPSVSIHVVVPHRLGLTIVPQQSWCLVPDKEYTLAVRLYGVDNNELHLTDNVRISTNCAEEHFDVLYRSKNGSHLRVRTKEIGWTKCEIGLTGIDRNGKRVESATHLQESQKVEIVERIRVEPSHVVLPWDPHTKPSFTVNLKAVGGGGYGFHWKTSNPSLSVCDQSCTVTVKSVGSVNVTASSMCNLNNHDTAMVSVVLPDSIEVLTPSTEIQLGSVVRVVVAIYASLDKGIASSSKIAVSDCTEYPFAMDVTDSKRLQFMPDVDRSVSVKNACAALPFLADSIGLARLTVSLANEEASSRQASVVIVVYKPLTPIIPENLDESVLLAVGSSRRIVFEGGPKSWTQTSHNYFKKLNVEDEAIVSAILFDPQEMKNQNRHVFDVVCMAIGETSVVLRVGNRNTSFDGQSAMAEARIRVCCAYPDAIRLHPHVWRPEIHRTVCQADDHTVVAHCYRDLDIVVVLLNDQGKPFYNFSSLEIAWESSKPSVASFQSNGELLTADDQSYRTLHPNNIEEPVQITVSVSSYRQEFLTAASISSRLNTPHVAAKLNLNLVNDATFKEDSINLFNHPSSKMSVSVSKGSGQFEFEPEEQLFATIHYDDKRQEFQIAPKTEGSFVVTLIDVCLERRSAATLLVRVSGIKEVRVHVLDKVSLGKEITATVQILDQDAKIVPFTVFPLLHVQPHVASSLLSFRGLPDSLLGLPAFQFRIKGETLGHTTLNFTVSRKLSSDARQLDQPIASKQSTIQVFSPLMLNPRNITLIVGAVFQISSSGGPHPQANVEFEMKDPNVASVSAGSGIVEGSRLGATVVVGRAVGSDPETGTRVVYSEDEVPVHIVALDGVRIKSPLTRVQVGSTIPVYAIGLGDNEIPYAFGTAVPPLTFVWTIENKEIAVLHPFLHSCGIQLPDANHFMTRLSAKQPGQVTLTLQVFAAKDSSKKSNGDVVRAQVRNDAVLRDELQIHVFEKLRLVSPPFTPADILITPSTELQLVTNKDRTSVVHHRIVDSSCSDVADGIGVDANGLLHSGDRECRLFLQITSADEIGLNQTVSTVVTTKRISYMMVVSECSFQVRNRNLLVLPVGADSPFRVQFHDNVGNTFHLTNSRLKFRPSRFDLVRIEPGRKNETFYIKAIGTGFTVVRIWDAKNSGIEDYLLVSSGEIVSPSRATVPLGDRICFSCSVSTSAGSSGSWNVEDSSVLRMDTSGLAIATSVGTSTVIYNVSSEWVTTTELTVVPIHHVEFDKTHVKLLTNVHPRDRPYRLPLSLRSGGGGEHHASNGFQSNAANGGNCTYASSESELLYSPIHCSVRFENDVRDDSVVDVFDVFQGYDTATGRHECRLQAKPLPAPSALLWSTVTGHLEVTATVLEGLKQNRITSNKLRFPFVPAFHVVTPEVLVGDHQLQPEGPTSDAGVGVVVVSAVDAVFRHLTVRASDSTLIDVHALRGEDAAADSHQRRFSVTLNERFWKRVGGGSSPSSVTTLPAVHVRLHCSLTEQTVQVPVRFTLITDKLAMHVEGDEKSAGWSPLLMAIVNHYQGLAVTVVAIIGTIIAIFIGYQATYGQRYYAIVNQPDVFNTSLTSSQAYPSPGFNVFPASKHTPPNDRPHLWSVNEPVHGSPLFSRTPSPRFGRTPDRYVIT